MSDTLVFEYSVTPCECGSHGFRPADPVRCIECGAIPKEVCQRVLPHNAAVNIDVVEGRMR